MAYRECRKCGGPLSDEEYGRLKAQKKARVCRECNYAPPNFDFDAAALRVAAARRGPTAVFDRADEYTALPYPHRLFPEFSGEDILRIVGRPDWEERRAEAVSLNRAAAAEWMA